MGLDFDRIFEPEIKPAHDGVYDDEEEMEKFYAHLADQEHEYQARSEYEKQDLWFWGIFTSWSLHHSVGAGILLYLHYEDEL